MSVSLCAFRMEIASGHPTISFEQYQAPKLQHMASGGAPSESAGEAGGSRSRTRRHHDRRLTAPVTVETVIPQLVQHPGTSQPPSSHGDSGAVHGAEGATPPAGTSSARSSPASAATSSATDGTPHAAEPGRAGGEASPAGRAGGEASPPGRAGGEASLPAAESGQAGGEASPPDRAGGEASPPAAESGQAGGEASPPGRAGGEASPPAAEPAAARRDRERAARQQDGDVVMGPSGTAVSYAELVKSGREPPRTSRELTPPEQPQLQQKPFISGNPFVEVTQGLLHLYKENAMTSLEDGVERSEMICMLSVPAKMVIHDLLQFTAACYPDIERMRIIRDNTPNQYMVLLKFRTQAAADEFYRNFNGVAYNSLEPETCRLVYVSRVDLVNESDEARLPIPGFTELPTCPVCLERMDESVDGVLTVLCNHSFHGSCLSQWGDTSCPVCRYVQTPELVEDNFCFECQAGESLWICLICGHVGCGRYVGGHAYSHFLDTGHTYTMRVGSTRVWDYVGDNFVHRLVQNDDDGKMVEVERGSPGADRDHKQGDCGEKLEGIQLEYTYLLTSQLQSQRQYYEECIARIEKEAQQEAEDLKERARMAVEETVGLKEKLQQVSAGRTSSENKVSQLSQRMTRCLKELQEERDINKSLRDNQACWQQRVQQLETKMAASNQQKDKELSELRDQVRDLMFFLEAQQKIASSSTVLQQELAEGNIVVPDTPPPPKHGGARKKKR